MKAAVSEGLLIEDEGVNDWTTSWINVRGCRVRMSEGTSDERSTAANDFEPVSKKRRRHVGFVNNIKAQFLTYQEYPITVSPKPQMKLWKVIRPLGEPEQVQKRMTMLLFDQTQRKQTHLLDLETPKQFLRPVGLKLNGHRNVAF
jgi:hypothetical protein